MMKQQLIKSWSLLNNVIILITYVLLSYSYSVAQNLTPNYSFEDTLSCPLGMPDGEISLAYPWYSPTTGTPDLFNACNTAGAGVPSNGEGTEAAKSGNGYCGIYTFSPLVPEVREYIQVALLDTLITGKKYYVDFYVSLADLSKYSANDIGAYFSISAVGSSDYYVLPYVPQIANSNNPLTSDSGWYKISGSFISTGGEKYITIGNFKNDASTDTLTVNPGSNWDAAYYYIDDVLVMEDTSNSIDDLTGLTDITFFPNPAKEEIIFTDNFSSSSMSITNLFGQKVYCGKFEKELDVSFLKAGVYVIEVAVEGKILREKFVKE